MSRATYPGDMAIAFRALQDAWLEGTAMYWRRRAEQLETARPRRSDFHGQATAADVRARCDRLTEAAVACRARADMADTSRAEFVNTLVDMAGSSR